MNLIKNIRWVQLTLTLLCLAFTSQTFCGEIMELMNESNKLPVLVISAAAPKCLQIAAKDFQEDFYEATGQKLEIVNKIPKGKTVIIAGVADQCSLLKSIDAKYKIDLGKLHDKWETFVIQPINNKNILIVAGSDPRGAMYGIYELSERLLGTDPLKFWTGHIPDRQDKLVWRDGIIKEGPPTFQYRGLFINDEDSLLCWKNVDRNVEPEVAEEILETICRLKGNMIAPAMYANYMTEKTRQLVHDRELFYTASHLEILLTNPSVGYWDRFTKAKYGKALPYSFVRHPKEMEAFWRDSVKRHGKFLNVWPIGLRGFDDRDFSETDDSAPKTVEERAALTGKAITVQRAVLKKELSRNVKPITSLTMRGEVYEQYKTGKMNLPEDAMLIWQDSGSFATVPFLPEGAEQTRKGGNGIYYHLSYCDNQWVQWVPLNVIQNEFKKVIDAGIKRYVLFNVGDMREIPMSMAAGMDLAWNAKPWLKNAGESRCFLEEWCAYHFGQNNAKEIADIYEKFWELEYPSRVTSVTEVVVPNVTSDLIATIWKQESLTKLAKKNNDPNALAEYAAKANFNSPGGRLGKVSPEYLNSVKPRWDALYNQAISVFKKVPEKDRQFYFDNIILQLQTSRLVNHWSVDAIDAFKACAKKQFGEAANLFQKAAVPMQQMIDEREKACHGKWKNWFRGEMHNGWQNSLWALKPQWLLRDTKTLVEIMKEADNLYPGKDIMITIADKNNFAVKIRSPKNPEIKNVSNELNKFFKERGFSVITSTKKTTDPHARLILITEKYLKKSSLPKS